LGKRKYTGTELGMLAGIAIGGGLGTALFASTGQPLFIAATGVGLIIGLIIGSGMDRRRVRPDDRSEE
jgi:outer membrane lipoprotein SlyB